MPTGSTLPVSWCSRSFTKVSVSASTLVIGPLSHIAVSMLCASRSPVTPEPASLGVQPPQRRPALRHVLGDGPVLQELGAVVVGPPDPALVDQLPGEAHRGHAAVVVPDHVRHAGLLDRGHHRLALGHVHGERLLAQDRLAVGGRRQRDLLVQVVGHADVDGVDVVALDQLAPVGLGRGVAPGRRRTPATFAASRAQTACSTGRCSSSGKKFATLR